MYKVIIINENTNEESCYDLSANGKMVIKIKKGELSTNLTSKEPNIKTTQQVIRGSNNIISGNGDIFFGYE
jgi:hypothetical protein